MSGNAYKILHIEDDLTDALLVQEMFVNSSSEMYQFVHVGDLKHALSALRADGYSAVLLDLGLRELQGLDNIRIIKQENPDVPIIVLTAQDDETLALEALQEGAQEYLVKGHGDCKIIRMAIKASITRKVFERKLFKQANYDPMTNLPNRQLFIEYLSKSLTKAARWNRSEALLFVDIDHFKHINDTYGHEAGNVLLAQVAERMRGALRNSDIIARYGGDEFIVLLDDRTENMEHAGSCAAQKILDVFEVPYTLHGHEVAVTASIGIAAYPGSGMSVTDLIERADATMYKTKRAGGNGFSYAGSGVVAAMTNREKL